MSFETDLRERFYLLSQAYPGYNEVLAQALFGLVARKHMLWFSKPGRAKSEVARAVFGMFDGAPIFSRQLTKDTMPEAVFGNLIPKRLMDEGKEIYNLEGGLVTATFAYLDEFFDASDFMLRSMLSVLNERIFESKDMGMVKAGLHSAILTTNYIRERDATEAVLDRIACKAMVPGIADITDCMVAGRTYLGFNDDQRTFKPLSYEALLDLSTRITAQEADQRITISPGMRLLHVLLVQEFQKRRYDKAAEKWRAANPKAVNEPTATDLGVPEISPRTLVGLHDFTRAAAALSERWSVQACDNRAMGYGLYIVGDESGDDLTWHALCDEFLSLNNAQCKSLDKLGEHTDEIGRIKAERSQNTTGQIAVGGVMVEKTALSIRSALDKLGRKDHPVLLLAQERLSDELTALGKPKPYSGFDLLRGW